MRQGVYQSGYSLGVGKEGVLISVESEAERINGTNSGTKERKEISPYSPLCSQDVQKLKTNMWAVLDYPVGQLGIWLVYW